MTTGVANSSAGVGYNEAPEGEWVIEATNRTKHPYQIVTNWMPKELGVEGAKVALNGTPYDSPSMMRRSVSFVRMNPQESAVVNVFRPEHLCRLDFIGCSHNFIVLVSGEEISCGVKGLVSKVWAEKMSRKKKDYIQSRAGRCCLLTIEGNKTKRNHLVISPSSEHFSL